MDTFTKLFTAWQDAKANLSTDIHWKGHPEGYAEKVVAQETLTRRKLNEFVSRAH